MYDARGPQTGNKSNLIFGAAIIAVIVIAFFGILMMPSGGKSNAPVPMAATSDTSTLTLLGTLDDPATVRFVSTLQRVAPDVAKRLDGEVGDAVKRGADQKEVVTLVLQVIQNDMPAVMRYVEKADVRHFDKMVLHMKTGLQKMQGGGGKWCKGATYEKFADQNPVTVQRMIEREFAYGSVGYQWSMDLSTLILEAAEDGRANPQSYGKMTARDESALQGLMFKMIGDPQVMKLMTMQGASKAEMAKASRNINFCALGVTALSAVNGLPTETRGRLWAEGLRKVKSGDFEKQMSAMGGMGMLGGS
jgi:hypothetical protein